MLFMHGPSSCPILHYFFLCVCVPTDVHDAFAAGAADAAPATDKSGAYASAGVAVAAAAARATMNYICM